MAAGHDWDGPKRWAGEPPLREVPKTKSASLRCDQDGRQSEQSRWGVIDEREEQRGSRARRALLGCRDRP